MGHIRKEWTADETASLFEMAAAGLTARAIGDALGRSYDSIRSRASVVGGAAFPDPRIAWTPAMDAHLREMWGTVSTFKMTAIFDCSAVSIERRAAILNLGPRKLGKKRMAVIDDMDAFVAMAFKNGVAFMAAHYRCSETTILSTYARLPADTHAALLAYLSRRRAAARRANAKPKLVAKAIKPPTVNFGFHKPVAAPLQSNSIASRILDHLRCHKMRFTPVYNAGREHGRQGPYVAGRNRLPDLDALVAFGVAHGYDDNAWRAVA